MFTQYTRLILESALNVAFRLTLYKQQNMLCIGASIIRVNCDLYLIILVTQYNEAAELLASCLIY